MRFTFEVAGDKLIDRELLRIGSRAVDGRPVFTAIAGYMMEETKEQFDSEGKHASGGWKPIKAATIQAKQARGLDLRILHATGALERSLTQPGDSNQLLVIRRNELRFGSKLVYAGVHQNPSDENPLPRRRPVEFTELAKRRVVKMIQRYVVTGEVFA